MSPETETKIDLVLFTLQWMQEEGADVPPPGQVSLGYLAALSKELGEPVSKSAWQSLSALAESRASHAARQRGLQFFRNPETEN